MGNYYINKNAQGTGEHEVHTDGCSHPPNCENRKPLGSFNNCQQAIQVAKNKYPNDSIDGCAYCCHNCHTK